MKRLIAAFCMSFALLSCTGCAMQSTPGSVSNKMNGGFSADVTMTTADNEVKGTLTRYGSDAWSVIFTEPPALSGVQLDFTDDEVAASYKGLAFSVPQSAQAVRTMLEELMDIVDDMSQETELDCKQKEELLICEGEIDEGSYTLTFSEDGTPQSFTLPSYGLTITFDTFTQNGSTSQNATETLESSGTVPSESVTETGTTETAAQ